MMLKLIVVLLCVLVPSSWGTALNDYVNKPDPNYNYTVKDWKYKGPGYTLYLINMTSQQWLTEKESSQPIWWHNIVVAVPDKLTHLDSAFMYISGSGNGDTYVPKVDGTFVGFVGMMAVSTGSICFNLRNIPNQPIVFKNDPTQQKRVEDAIIAWTWMMFVEQEPDRPEWLLRLPMTKASVRAMDTITDFAKTLNPKTNIQKFTVCGESKRGWTTWTTAAVDKRVVAIAPIVMDLLNVQKNLHHHFQSLGGWTFAFADYYALNFTRNLDAPNTDKMCSIIDPYVYIDALTMPKFIITTGGDEFFIPDDAKFYIQDLKGEVYLRRIPNAEHSLKLHRLSLFFSIQAFYQSILTNSPRPKLRWEKKYTSTGGILTVYTDTKPHTIGVEHTTTIQSKRRDFRLVAADPNNPSGFEPQLVIWVKNPVVMVKEGVYQATFDNPPEGWRAFFIEMTFAGSTDVTDFEFCTETMIIPDKYAHADCHGQECLGTLV